MRLHWHVEDGLSAFIPPGGQQVDPQTGVHHVVCEIELAGQTTTIPGLFTLPASYQLDGATSTVGVILAHGNQAPTYKGKLLNQMATTLAQAGHVVVRYFCAGKEQRRLRLFEKVLDAAVTSPYARNVTRWVLGGIGSGARVCASVGSRCRASVAGYLLLAYPLQEPVSVFKGPPSPDSTGPLLKVKDPVLLVHPEKDPYATTEQLVEVASRIPSWDIRLVEMPGVDGYFRDAETRVPPTEAVRKQLCDIALQFTRALANGSLNECSDKMPSIRPTYDDNNPAPQPPPAPLTVRNPLIYPPYHLFEQEAHRMQGGPKGLESLPPPVVGLLALAQQYHEQQEQLIAAAFAPPPQAAEAAPMDATAAGDAGAEAGGMQGPGEAAMPEGMHGAQGVGADGDGAAGGDGQGDAGGHAGGAEGQDTGEPGTKRQRVE